MRFLRHFDAGAIRKVMHAQWHTRRDWVYTLSTCSSDAKADSSIYQ